MELIDVQPKDFMFLFGMTLTDLKSFKVIMDNMQFNFDGSKEEHVKAKEYLELKLYPTIKEGLKAVEEFNDGP